MKIRSLPPRKNSRTGRDSAAVRKQTGKCTADFHKKRRPHMHEILFPAYAKPHRRKRKTVNAVIVVSQERFELTTHRLEGGCSIQLSY